MLFLTAPSKNACGIEALLWPYRNELEFGEEFPLSKEALGAAVEEKYHGVYYVGWLAPFPTQVVVSSRLDAGAYAALRAMTPDAAELDARDLITQSRDNEGPGFLQNMDAVLQVSVVANRGLYERIR